MKTCKCCNLYIDENSKFCPYCGKKLSKAVQEVELETATQKLTVKQEVYKYKGEARNRYAFYTDLQDKISSFVPDFSAEIEDAWLFGDDRIFIVTNQQGIVKLRELGINKKGSTEICKLPYVDCCKSRKLYAAEDGRFLFCEKRYIKGKDLTVFYLINGNDIFTYSVEDDVPDVELYTDDCIVCNQGDDNYLLTLDGIVQTASSLYDKEKLLHRYHMKCIEENRFDHPEIIWDSPYVRKQFMIRDTEEILVEFGYRYNSFANRHDFTIKLEQDLPIEQTSSVIMDASEWEKEAADIRHMEELQKKDNPQWKIHDRLCAFYRFSGSFIYGTGEKEQFIYNRESRSVLFFPIGKHGSGEMVLEFAKEYTNKHPENILIAQKLERMHLLDSVTEKLIRTQETRLQPFLQYMEKAWQYDSMVKGEKNFCNITYSIGRLLADTDMVIGVVYTDDEGKGMIGWTERDVMYTERATDMLVRMNTPYGKKVVEIPFGTEVLSGVYMADDQPANNRNEWYAALADKWKFYPRKELPKVSVPYNMTNACSSAVNMVEMAKFNLYSDNYQLPYRPDKTSADLYYSPDGYKLKPDESVGSFYYRIDDNVKAAVDYLTDIHLYTLCKDGIFYIKNRQLYFRGSNNESRSYDGKYFDSVSLHASDHYIFIDCVDKYIEGKSYDSCGYTMYITEFSVIYRTEVISRATGERVAIWDLPEITHIYQYRDNTITIATGATWYNIPDSDEGIKSLSDSWNRSKKGKQVLTKENMGEEAYSLIEKYGIRNFVGSMNNGTIRMIVDGAYKDFS